MKFKVYKVTLDKKQTLELQLEVGEVRPGTSPADTAVDYVLKNVRHQLSEAGVRPIMDSDGVHLTKWLVLDDADIYWFIPGGRFRKSPAPVKVEFKGTCRLGYCVTKNSHYQGGDRTIREKLRAGICPICGGPVKKI
ncbi:hypothetical protein LCGC14_2263060 [marine sediment metagenome]|uniref:Uncharacterized protein n=1 Tax=marine sediment metagenome TaxID=412755 RepID=A0A0F9DLF8_9ZZZZ